MSLSALAYRYADALWLAANEANASLDVLRDLAALKAKLDARPAAWGVLFDQSRSAGEKEAAIQAELAQTHRLVRNAVRLMLARSREQALREFFRAYLEVHQRNSGVLGVKVESPAPLNAEERKQLVDGLAAATGRKIDLEEGVRPELLAGVRITVDSRLIDGSVEARIRRIREGLRAVAVGGAQGNKQDSPRK
jgi:F-type H+-transporting ATPase subunit delta